MAHRIRTSIPMGVRRPRRATEWLGSADVNAVSTLAASGVVLDQAFTQAQFNVLGPVTIVRTRGILWVKSDQSAATEEPFGAMGMMVVTEQARVAGIGSLPTPITEEFDDGFFVHQFWQGGITVGSDIGVSNVWHRYEFDSKAQRKVDSDDALVVTLENASASHGVRHILKFRILVKLS